MWQGKSRRLLRGCLKLEQVTIDSYVFKEEKRVKIVENKWKIVIVFRLLMLYIVDWNAWSLMANRQEFCRCFQEESKGESLIMLVVSYVKIDVLLGEEVQGL